MIFPNSDALLWQESDWRCELHDGGAGVCRLFVYRGDILAAVESAPTGHPAHVRAEVLRQRALGGHLTTN